MGFEILKFVEYVPLADLILFVLDVILNLSFDNFVTVPVNGLVNVENVGVSVYDAAEVCVCILEPLAVVTVIESPVLNPCFSA